MGITHPACPYSDPVITLDVVRQSIRRIYPKAPVVRFENGVYHLADGSQVDCCDGCGAFLVAEIQATTTDPAWPDEPPHESVATTCGRCR